MSDDLTTPVTPNDWVPDSAIIKVIGVGGGGCNAVNYMYKQDIKGCSFIVCNTDEQALMRSPVPVKIQMGAGLGAGTDPVAGRNAAMGSAAEIAEKALDNGTKMLFITAGMGGGTGTGAAPVIAHMAKERGILTVAVVTIPYQSEGTEAMGKAIDGIHELERNVDSLLIINNQKIFECFGDKLLHEAFPKSDEVLSTAVKGIIEIIKRPGYINVDFRDVTNMMRGSGMALMGHGEGRGENRLEDAVRGAFESPLLNDFDLSTSKNFLINITEANTDEGILTSDLEKINAMIQKYTGDANKFKTGIIYDDSIGDAVMITAIATGFDMGKLGDIADLNLGNLIILTPDFTYTPLAHTPDEAPDPYEGRSVVKIGFDRVELRSRFDYDPLNKPVLVVTPGQDRSALESVPAIRRVSADKIQ
ncbi:MAG: cell division protein FtsZ [Bacteroidales bacterium]|nr:cell division protein FtsZ [Bacteroidales bacterium]